MTPDPAVLRIVDRGGVAWDNAADTFLLHGFPVDADTRTALCLAVSHGFADKPVDMQPSRLIPIVLTDHGKQAIA